MNLEKKDEMGRGVMWKIRHLCCGNTVQQTEECEPCFVSKKQRRRSFEIFVVGEMIKIMAQQIS